MDDNTAPTPPDPLFDVSGKTVVVTGGTRGIGRMIAGGFVAAGADVIVTGCPMCHSNLDMRQLAIRDAGRSAGDLPVLYLSELLCLAAGADPKAIGLDAHFIDAMPLAARSQP